MFKSTQTAQVMADALEIPLADVTPDLALGQSQAWTSLAHMRLILALEERIKRRLTPAEIVGLMAASDVDTLLISGDAAAE